MAGKGQAYAPSMTDAAVKARTGKDWKAWFTLLDKQKAETLPHKAIAALLHDKHKVPGWWCQMVAVEYERARGLREKHETATGFSVNVTKTFPATVPTLYAAVADAPKRVTWFPRGRFEPSSQTPDKYYRGAWKDGARLEFGFYARGDKSQIAVQISKLESKLTVEAERRLWKLALAKLALQLARRSP